MALIEIVCPKCRHSGVVNPASLPRILRCYDCGEAHMAEKGRQIVRSRLAHDVDDQEYPTTRRGRPPSKDESGAELPAPERV